ncbi:MULTISPECIES: bifunctional 2-polyprenyl-6-hydroxyphenol methylase/3-demethylubiquinol 3-O-methyltransferase UbiG [unclassified Cyanobium]|uniref:class I SAM-dependent methyltransferase n=1 Tax=unclassified Cyanobium TaxID=2627006 RepID=UPI0020CE1105|nr:MULTISPECIES: class I SAM-dependent methyltransferase [unclassified Cyanobium]MCP9860315.1 class I SAM-dependent methyltransferase [Cyanobium sp. Cruz-8H5]MCP9867582.1 class I SAM-dependent methyltransferase [Cyanobium sp. Cruz-8D1]
MTAAFEDCEYLFHRCEDCRSLNEFSEEGSFYEKEQDTPFMNYYIDIIAGLDEMLAPIGSYVDASRSTEGKTFLELGCGFGFVVDYAAKCRGFQAAGIEPGGYGRLGQQYLGADISATLLGEGSHHDQEQFDIIFSSEVIEHIPTPKQFAATVSRHIKSEGVAIFTTPNAEFITPESPAAEAYSALFPGEHKILFSAKGLSLLLSKAGFSHLAVKQRRSSNLIAYAASSPGPIALAEAAQSGNATTYTREYLATYRHSALSRTEKISRLGLAMHYRLFKDFVNNGWADQAIDLLLEMRPSFRCEVDPGMSFTIPTQSGERTEILHEMLCLCGICLLKESILSQDHHLPYPAGSIAFGKTMGFYITTVIHQVFKPEPSTIIDSAINYLNTFIDYGMWLRSSRRADYHLEAISLIGPAVASLFLFLLKAGAAIDKKRYSFVEEPWFRVDHPVSYDEIQTHLNINRKRQEQIQPQHPSPKSPQPHPNNPFRRVIERLRK